MAMGEVALAMGRMAWKDVLFFPVWWYTKGVVYMINRLVYSARKQAASFAVQLWVKNLFVPMYGQYDWQGRIISFFVRLIQIVVRSFAYTAWIGVLLCIAVAYIVVPLVLGVLIVLHAGLAV